MALPFILDMVHHNPAEALIESEFNNPAYLAKLGYTGQVINDFSFVHCTALFNDFDASICPPGSPQSAWAEQTAASASKRIALCKKSGISAYFFIDIAVLPKLLVENYQSEICDTQGHISLHRPLTLEIHRVMFREIFTTFPDLDGLVIRTGETYLHNVPYHTGNNPITQAEESHIILINLLRQEVCEKLGKIIFYRTWDADQFHVKPEYYLNVTNTIAPHENLIFSIKHTAGDFHRTLGFNPTLGIGKHRQIVEIQCQREFEGKGSYPNYIAHGVIEGFEETKKALPPRGLRDLLKNPLFCGIWTWSRGGGWKGPYIKNEFWCTVNARVLSSFAQHPDQNEKKLFYDSISTLGFSKNDTRYLRKICLLSAAAIIRGRLSVRSPIFVWWMRDHFLGGLNELGPSFEKILSAKKECSIIREKEYSVKLWKKMSKYSEKIKVQDSALNNYFQSTVQYGLLLYQIIAAAWTILIYGMKGDKTGVYNKKIIRKTILQYDALWELYHSLSVSKSPATPYLPYAFVFKAPEYHNEHGMKESVDLYREI